SLFSCHVTKPHHCPMFFSLNRKFRLTQNHSKKWRTPCEGTSNWFCDLNPLNLHYLGVFTLRVRATVNGNQSEWAHVDFAPAKEGDGTPTRVLVSHAGNDLEVSISEPQTSNNTSMKDKISSLYYRFLYWEQHTNHKVSLHQVLSNSTSLLSKDLLFHQRNFGGLPDLKSWTWYCVSVQSRTIEPNRTSTFTDPVCISTQGMTIWIFVTSLLLVLISVLTIPLGCYCKKRFKTHVPRLAFLEEVWKTLSSLSFKKQTKVPKTRLCYIIIQVKMDNDNSATISEKSIGRKKNNHLHVHAHCCTYQCQDILYQIFNHHICMKVCDLA
uniref:Interferon/interleukin receptor domain-containing protein n=1 Tax=Neogobius melanostomus TaxID=47308 RepID=A0A8C6TJ87_9GOBI